MKLRLFSETIGLPVIVEYMGHPLDYVRGILIDPENGKIAAFLLSRNSIVTPFDVLDWGQAIVIGNESHIVPLDDVLRAKVISEMKIPIIGQKTVTQNNEYLGRIYDLSFQAGTFVLHQLYVMRGFLFFRWFQTIIPAANIVRITRKHVVVRSSVEKKEEKIPITSFNPA